MLSVAVVAGEASGDASGALLAFELRKLCPEITVWGAGGQQMREAGVELVADFSWAGAIGMVESVKLAPRLFGRLGKLKGEFLKRRPDVFVPIDFGAFNVRLARFARAQGIPTVYFFPPGSWRRRPKNQANLLAAADKIVTPFPWSEALLREAGADVVFPGHPMLDRVAPTMPREAFLAHLGLPPEARFVGLVPGSRPHEINSILPALIGAACRVAERLPEFGTFVIPAASEEAAGMAKCKMRNAKCKMQNAKCKMGDSDCGAGAREPSFCVVRGLTYDVMAHSDLLLTCSGTATLEAMIIGTPMIIVYRGSRLMKVEYMLRRGILEEFIGMPNIVAGRMICPELLGDQASAERMADLAVELLGRPEKLETQKSELQAARAVLGKPGGTRRAAEVILEAAKRSIKA